MEQEKKNPLSELMKATMEHVKTMADANTIIGTPIQAEGVTLIPVSKMSFGVGGGGTEFTTKAGAPKESFGGGSAASAKLEPVAFLVVREGEAPPRGPASGDDSGPGDRDGARGGGQGRRSHPEPAGEEGQERG